MLVRVVALLLLLPGLLAGCATPTRMAYSDESRTLVNPGSAVFLMTATVKNNYHPSFQPSQARAAARLLGVHARHCQHGEQHEYGGGRAVNP